MCQRLQNSTMLRALYGELKLSGNSILSIRDKPTAMSEYPEKSKYSCIEYANAPPHAATAFRCVVGGESNTGPTKGWIPSARMTFLDSPIVKSASPLVKF